jgi:ubiquinone biosynthesis protein Coq4
MIEEDKDYIKQLKYWEEVWENRLTWVRKELNKIKQYQDENRR